jgi:6-phospho-beta-glucosidase
VLYPARVRLTILGGGGFRVPLIYRALARRENSVIDEVVLYDADPGRSAVISAVLAGEPGPPIRIEHRLETAVAGTDVVFSAIRVGGAKGRVRDERRALSRGVLGQETVGAGGLAYALRTLPVALQAAAAVRELAPDAWLINFTNPAGLVTQALRDVLGEKVIGICDSPTGLIRRACRAAGVDDVTATVDYVGINHLGWLRGLYAHGMNHLPTLLADAAALDSFEEGRLFGGPLLRAIGSLPNEYAYFYYAATDLVHTLRAGGTRGEQVAADQAAFYAAATATPARASALWAQTRRRREESYLAETRPADQQRDAADLSGGGYEQVALDVIDAVLGGRPAELIVNARNGFALPQLPADMVVEVPCTVDAAGATPLPMAPLDLHQLGLVASVRASEQAVIDAVRQGSRELALRAFVIHPLVGSPVIAQRILDALVTDHPELALLLR